MAETESPRRDGGELRGGVHAAGAAMVEQQAVSPDEDEAGIGGRLANIAKLILPNFAFRRSEGCKSM